MFGFRRDNIPRSKVLTIETLNENLKDCKYEVRGEIYLAAVKRTQKGKEVIYTNVGMYIFLFFLHFRIVLCNNFKNLNKV